AALRGVDDAARRAVAHAHRGRTRGGRRRRRRRADGDALVAPHQRPAPGTDHGVIPHIVAGGPVIPNYGTAHGCIANNDSMFCTTWIRQHWHDTLEPAIVQHLWLTGIAVGIGFAIAFAAALVAHRYGALAAPFGVFSAFLYTIPSIALFQLLVPVTGITVTTIEIGLVGYTLLILFRNTLTGLRDVPEDVIEAARGMGLNSRQIMTRVELPLALPALMAGLRCATVTTIPP